MLLVLISVVLSFYTFWVFWIFYDERKLFFFFCLCLATCGISVPWPGIEPQSPAVKMPSLNHWTIREFPLFSFLQSTPLAGIIAFLFVYWFIIQYKLHGSRQLDLFSHHDILRLLDCSLAEWVSAFVEEISAHSAGLSVFGKMHLWEEISSFWEALG